MKYMYFGNRHYQILVDWRWGSLILRCLIPGERLSSLKAVDEDEDQEYTYQLIHDAGGLFSLQGPNLTATRAFDFENPNDRAIEFTITVNITDNGQPALSVGHLTIKLKYSGILLIEYSRCSGKLLHYKVTLMNLYQEMSVFITIVHQNDSVTIMLAILNLIFRGKPYFLCLWWLA